MGYLQVLNLMVRAYKAARGVMPKGLDLLKLQQKARQKVIDSKKVIQFPKDRITDPFKPRPTQTESMMKQTGIPVTVKGKTTTMTPDGILKMLMKQGKGKDVKLGQAPKTTKVKPSVDPKLVQQESTRELYQRLMRSNREAIRNFKKRNKDDPTKKAEGGIMGYALGGRTQNIIGTYQANPTLQDKYTQQEYLDLFDQSTTTTPTTTTTTTTNVVDPNAGIVTPNIVKPIIPINQGDGGDGGGGITKTGPNRFDYGYTSLSDDLVQGESLKGSYRTPNTAANLAWLSDIGEGTIADEDYDNWQQFGDSISGIKSGIGDFYKYMPSQIIKSGFQKAADFSRDIVEQRRIEKEIKEAQEKARLADELARQMNAVYYDNPGADFTGGRYDGADSRSSYDANPTSYSGSS